MPAAKWSTCQRGKIIIIKKNKRRKKQKQQTNRRTSDADRVTNLWNIVLGISFFSPFACMADYSILFFSCLCATSRFYCAEEKKNGSASSANASARAQFGQNGLRLVVTRMLVCVCSVRAVLSCVHYTYKLNATWHTDSILVVAYSPERSATRKKLLQTRWKKKKKNETKETAKDIHFKLQTRLMSFDCYWVTGCRLSGFFCSSILFFSVGSIRPCVDWMGKWLPIK